MKKIILIDMISGANDYTLELVSELSKITDLTVVTVDNTLLKSLDNINLLPIFPAFGGSSSKLRKIYKTISSFIYLFWLLVSCRDSHIHVQFFRFNVLDIIFYSIVSIFNKKIYYTAHNILPHEKKCWHSFFYKYWYRKVKRIHVLSTYSKNEIIKLSNLNESKIAVIPHGNYEKMRFASSGANCYSKTILDVPSDTKIGLIFGLIREYKGIDRLISAVKLIDSNLKFKIVIAGGGDNELVTKLRQQVSTSGLNDKFIFIHRFLSNDELASLLEMSDFTIFPYHHIYQSGALLMALTFGKAIICSDIPGFQEYVTHNVDAILCDTTNSRLFADSMDKLIKDDILLQSLSVSAKNTSTERYSWSKIVNEMSDFYEV